jgi:uncharacterized protein with PIN domain
MTMTSKLDHNVEPAWMCVACGYMMDASAPTKGEKSTPETGDLSLCMNCGKVYWREDAKWRPITPAEYASLEPETHREIALANSHRGRVIRVDLAAKPGRA